MKEILNTLGVEAFRVILDCVGEGVYVLDGDGRIIYWSAACEALTGFGQDEVMGARCSDQVLMHVDSAGKKLCLSGCLMAATFKDGEAREAEVYLRHRDGHRMPVRMQVRPLRSPTGEIVAVVQSFRDIADKVAALEQVKELESLAYIDPLTGIGNRRFLDDALEARTNESRRHGWTLGLVMADIDHFKIVNDTYGHETGDQVLRMISRTLHAATRSYDVLGRWGGEELLVILTKTSTEDIANVAERYRTLVEESALVAGGERVRVTISLGAALADRGYDSPSSLLARADSLLYRSKQAGRNRVSVEGLDRSSAVRCAAAHLRRA